MIHSIVSGLLDVLWGVDEDEVEVEEIVEKVVDGLRLSGDLRGAMMS